jgi:putative aldouronate transport system permease protein
MSERSLSASLHPARVLRGRRRVRRYAQLYLVLLLPLALLLTFSYVPMYGATLAFRDFVSTRGILRSPWAGLKYFRFFFSTPSCLAIIRNTLAIGLYSLAASTPPPILLAIALNEARNALFKKGIQMITYAPFFISTVVMVSIILQLLDMRIGVVNLLVVFLGGKPINFMGISRLFTSIYVWSGVWQGTGYGAILYLAALTSIDPSLYEAAIMDGASKLQRIRHIDFPSLLPTIAILLILNFGQIMNVGFEKVFLMQNPANLDTAEVISTYIYKVGLITMNYSFSTAVGLFNSVVNCVLIVAVNAVVRRISETGLW